MNVATNPSTSPSHQSRSRLVAPLAKAAGILLALVSGIYAVLSYYSSIAALRQSVEANKLTLLIYCDSNNNTDRACDEVRHDLSTEQAVEEVFGGDDDDGNGSDDDDSSTQTVDGNQQQQQSSMISPPGAGLPNGGYSAATSTSGHDGGPTSSPKPTTFLTSTAPTRVEVGISCRSCIFTEPFPSRPTVSPASTFTPGPQPPDSPGPSDYSSWHATCTTLHRRALAARNKFILVCDSGGPPPVPLARDVSYSTEPTSPLSDSCSELEQQYLEASFAIRHYSCESLEKDVSSGWHRPTISPTRALPAIETGVVVSPGNNETISHSDHAPAAGRVPWIFGCICIALLVGLGLGLGLRKFHLVRRQQRRTKMVLGNGFDPIRYEMVGKRPILERCCVQESELEPELSWDAGLADKYEKYHD